MRTRTSVVALVVGTLALVGSDGVAGAAAPAKPATTVKVKLLEFKVKPRPKRAPAGTVTFDVKNIGGVKHEFVVVRSGADGALPTKPDGSVNESAIPKADQLGEVEGLARNKSGTLKAKMKPGTYVLFCNVVEKPAAGGQAHYAEGMHRTFVVR